MTAIFEGFDISETSVISNWRDWHTLNWRSMVRGLEPLKLDHDEMDETHDGLANLS